MDVPYYPTHEFGPLMKGLIIGGIGIVHVFLAQFAIGGGLLMCYFQWLAGSRGSQLARQFVDGYFKVLVLISFVVGAVTGVGLWLTSIQISPRTIGIMVDEFHWVWATEWTFFCLEIVAGYSFYRYSRILNDRNRLFLLATYSAAAWFSLFWINGILSWQLTPGEWVAERNVWAGFFNPSFLPSLIFRTVTSMVIAALVACIVINLIPDLSRSQREKLIAKAGHFTAPMVLMPLLGIWYMASIPADSRQWIMGGSVAMTMFFALGIGCSLLIGGYALFSLLRGGLYINVATATLLCLLGFLATAGGEFVREGVRKPYTIRTVLYSNSVTPDELAYLRRVGSVTNDPYPLLSSDEIPTDQLQLGAKVFRFQCSVCHTVQGANGLTHLTGTWTPMQLRLNVAQLQRTKPFMPPFAGTPEELEALAQWIEWHNSGSMDDWSAADSGASLTQIASWLDEVGTRPGIDLMNEPRVSGGAQ